MTQIVVKGYCSALALCSVIRVQTINSKPAHEIQQHKLVQKYARSTYFPFNRNGPDKDGIMQAKDR